MTLPILKALIDWDYNFENEFKHRDKGYTFVIDAWESPKLSLYKFTPFGIKCDHLETQPPQEMLVAAIQGQEVSKEKVYRINQEIKSWIEKNILKD
ncbi:hypothetical protein Dred_1802 [Desulforamulus reducens MI-1]|uniref:Uncharacterized protein n=1 Tax=Desulforamulus reducens (strain ATCC BAA-1160 / DSM 100696 / MI-1) TaxID=349161 RepID=A4J5H4_DESRM|nr:hypothetical protein [Desulforamulus reducens]ABO50327.1 hypothetical protein Dred_1802 [Desulforamulus reducens MI-1]